MLSFAAMKRHTVNDISSLAIGILRFTGLGLLLTPAYLQVETNGFSVWAIMIYGFILYLIAQSCQILYFMQVPVRRETIIRGLVILALFSLAGIFLRVGHFVEGLIFLTAGVNHIFTLPSIAKKMEGMIDPLQISIPIVGFITGIYLIFAGPAYDSLNLSPYHAPMVVAFLAASLIGTIPLFYKTEKLEKNLFRMQAIPWLAWCLIFLSSMTADKVITSGVLAIIILFADTVPWYRLALPEHDVLGRRVIMIANTLELTMLIFLSALLTLLDSAIDPSLGTLVAAREAAFLFFIITLVVIYYQVLTIIMMVNGLITELTKEDEDDEAGASNSNSEVVTWNKRLSRYLKPFTLTRESIRFRLTVQTDKINTLAYQLTNEKKRNSQLVLLNELSQQLENQLDQPVSAQLAVNTLERALNLPLVTLYTHEPDEKELLLLAAAGSQTNMLTSGYRQKISMGAIGRAARQRKTQIINDIRLDNDYIRFENESNLSCVIVPMIFNGHLNGVIVLNSEKVNAFGSIEIGLAESVAAELARAWERSGYHQRLMSLIQSGSHLSSMVEPETTAQEVASITREILQARFTFVQIQLGQEENFVQTAFSGDAPQLLESLLNVKETNPLVQAAFHAEEPFRVRDMRKYSGTSHLEIDDSSLRSMLAIPIRWHRLSIGAILAFGKQNEVFFSENDESLAELLSIQAAGAFESTWLQQELRASLRTTSLLYRLSTHIIQAENLHDAAVDIAQTAHKLAKGASTGIVLFSPDKKVEAELRLDDEGVHSEAGHPMEMVNQVMDSGQLIYISQGQSMTRACLPIQTPIRKYGVLWINIPEDQQHKPANPADLQTLVNQAAIALERSLLLVESRRQAAEIKAAYDTLESTYDQTLAALISALDARDRETEGHSLRVSRLAARLGETLCFSREQLKVLERGSLLHDIGKIGINDSILHKPGPLNEDEWKIMRLHPDIGSRIVEGIPFLQDTIPLIRHHQERWNGSGYPLGLKGTEIPELARMFAIVDAFDALISNRPYRQKISIEDAVEYLHEQAGILFDPEITQVFKKLVLENKSEFLFKE